jgi:hypothetical protein
MRTRAKAEETGAISRVCVHCRQTCDPRRNLASDRWLCTFCNQWQDEAQCPTCGQRTTLGRLKSYSGSMKQQVAEVMVAIMPDIVNLVRSKLEENRP